MTSAGGMQGALSGVTRLSRRDWTDFLRAQWALAKASWTLRRRRTGTGVMVRQPPGEGPAPQSAATRSEGGADPGAARRARQLSLAVHRACRWGPFRPRCLTRAVALEQLLRSEGLEGGKVRIGVRRDSDGFAAHAWVEYRGQILGDAPESVAEYSTLDDLDVLPRL